MLPPYAFLSALKAPVCRMLRYSPTASAAKSASFDISLKVLIVERKSFVYRTLHFYIIDLKWMSKNCDITGHSGMPNNLSVSLML